MFNTTPDISFPTPRKGILGFHMTDDALISLSESIFILLNGGFLLFLKNMKNYMRFFAVYFTLLSN